MPRKKLKKEMKQRESPKIPEVLVKIKMEPGTSHDPEQTDNASETHTDDNNEEEEYDYENMEYDRDKWRMRHMFGDIYSVRTTWDGKQIDHEPLLVRFKANIRHVFLLEVDACYFRDPVPPGAKKCVYKPYEDVHKYEAVSCYFLGDDDKYLEVVCGAHGQYYAALYHGRSNPVEKFLPLKYYSATGNRRWQAIAFIPKTYFPPGVCFFNIYSTHGVIGKNRVHEALYPVPSEKFENPDFHRLEYFRPLDFTRYNFHRRHPESTRWMAASADCEFRTKQEKDESL